MGVVNSVWWLFKAKKGGLAQIVNLRRTQNVESAGIYSRVLSRFFIGMLFSSPFRLRSTKSYKCGMKSQLNKNYYYHFSLCGQADMLETVRSWHF